MATTLAVYAFCLVAITFWVRPHLLSPAATTVALVDGDFGFTSSNGAPLTIEAQASGPPNSWTLSSHILDSAGHTTTAAERARVPPPELPHDWAQPKPSGARQRRSGLHRPSEPSLPSRRPLPARRSLLDPPMARIRDLRRPRPGGRRWMLLVGHQAQQLAGEQTLCRAVWLLHGAYRTGRVVFASHSRPAGSGARGRCRQARLCVASSGAPDEAGRARRLPSQRVDTVVVYFGDDDLADDLNQFNDGVDATTSVRHTQPRSGRRPWQQQTIALLRRLPCYGVDRHRIVLGGAIPSAVRHGVDAARTRDLRRLSIETRSDPRLRHATDHLRRRTGQRLLLRPRRLHRVRRRAVAPGAGQLAWPGDHRHRVRPRVRPRHPVVRRHQWPEPAPPAQRSTGSLPSAPVYSAASADVSSTAADRLRS